MKKKEIDRIDEIIIYQLQQDASLTNKALASKICLSEPATHVRIRNLFKRGVIKGVRANINLAYFGFDIQALLFVTVSSNNVEKLIANVMILREVCKCAELQPKEFVNDSRRFQIQIIAKSQDHVAAIIKDLFNQVEIIHFELYFLDKTIKDSPMSVSD